MEMLTCQPPHYDFWHKHKERAHFLFIEQAQGDSTRQLKYTGRHLVPNASPAVRKLLDCLFIRNAAHRPRSEDVLGAFAYDTSTSSYKINTAKLDVLKLQINEEQKKVISMVSLHQKLKVALILGFQISNALSNTIVDA